MCGHVAKLRIALGISYNGVHFEGWQSQPGGRGVQDQLERALAAVADAPIRVIAAGRTDAGVHATGQVVHFDTEVERPLSAWVRGTNAHLSSAVAVQWAREMSAEFHARFSASARRYHYLLYCAPVRPSVLAELTGWFHQPLDVASMRTAAEPLLGRHDFSTFRAAECQAKSPVRDLQELRIEQRGPYILFQFCADGFLHHMVRNIVGALVYVGARRQPPGWTADILSARDRSVAAPTFAARGLYLTAVLYPPRFEIQAESCLPWLWNA